MQAVVKIGTSQYLVSPGDELLVDRLPASSDKKMVFDQVLLLVDEKTVSVGQPVVAGVSVTVSSLADTKGEKIRVFKYKAKSRYRKTHGSRALLTRVQIDDIKTAASRPVVDPASEKPIHKTRAKKVV